MRRMSTNPSEYVVLDIETNGLGSKRDDLLSISFYKPDDGKEYNKFLPLELNRKIVTTHINGITKKDLIGATALTQREYERIVEEFELEAEGLLARCILHENDHLDGVMYVDKVEGKLYDNEELYENNEE